MMGCQIGHLHRHNLVGEDAGEANNSSLST